MSALPNAVAQAAAATALVPCAVVHEFVVHSVCIRVLNSVVTVEAAGMLCSPLPSTLLAIARRDRVNSRLSRELAGAQCAAEQRRLQRRRIHRRRCSTESPAARRPLGSPTRSPRASASAGSCCCTAKYVALTVGFDVGTPGERRQGRIDLCEGPHTDVGNHRARRRGRRTRRRLDNHIGFAAEPIEGQEELIGQRAGSAGRSPCRCSTALRPAGTCSSPSVIVVFSGM